MLGIYGIYERWLWHQVKNEARLDHIAIILDGNRRWAFEQSLNPWIGHHHGADKIEDLLNWCLDLDVKSITLYAFSTENWQRSKAEISALMKLL